MLCKICNKNIDEKFYLHLNRSHKIKKQDYLDKFPEQQSEYDNQIPKENWNKGLTKENNSSVAKGAEKLKQYCNTEFAKNKRSKIMKKLYKNGDLLDKETRLRVVKSATKGWVDKVKNSSLEERKNILFNFINAGNEAQKEYRKNRTPEDYQRLYPWAKGVAVNLDCSFCGKSMISWLGGKPRPKRRFCNNDCKYNYQRLHPNYFLAEIGERFYSEKMGTEFFLRSNLEIWFASLLEKSDKILSWSTVPFPIIYNYENSSFRYFADFFINGKILLELKSGYIFNLQKDKTEAKLKEANAYAQRNNFSFVYWQFNASNMTEKKFLTDERVQNFLKEI